MTSFIRFNSGQIYTPLTQQIRDLTKATSLLVNLDFIGAALLDDKDDEVLVITFNNGDILTLDRRIDDQKQDYLKVIHCLVNKEIEITKIKGMVDLSEGKSANYWKQFSKQE